MLGKRSNRIYTENCGNKPNKLQKLDHPFLHAECSQTTTQSKCITPENNFKELIPDVCMISEGGNEIQ
jgi:hypothetical protein